MMDDFDSTGAVVVGGGPAGLATAIALRLRNIPVTLFDCAVPPIDKVCGEGLMPGSIRVLRSLGIEIPGGAGYAFRGIRFLDGDCCATADFPGEQAVGLRRTVLHGLMEQRAREVGVTLQWGIKNIRFTPDRLSVNNRRVQGRLIVAADGQNSPWRRATSLHRPIYERRRYGFRRHFAIPPWSRHVELYWGKRCQAYVTPIAEGEVGVAVLTSDPKLRLKEALNQFPQLKAHLSLSACSSSEMGSLTVFRKFERVTRPGFALVGDASGSVDAITGEGLCLAFHQALHLAEAYEKNELSRYETAHRALHQRPATMSRLLLTLAQHPAIRRRAMVTLAAHPDFFSKLLAVHIGEAGFSELCNLKLLNVAATFAAPSI